MVGKTSEGYSGARAAEIVGITYRQLDYWARTDLVRPSLVDAKGSGSRRRYSYRDLLELKVIKSPARRRHQARVGPRGVHLPARQPRRGRHHRQPGDPGQPGRAGRATGASSSTSSRRARACSTSCPRRCGARRRRPHRRAAPGRPRPRSPASPPATDADAAARRCRGSTRLTTDVAVRRPRSRRRAGPRDRSGPPARRAVPASATVPG